MKKAPLATAALVLSALFSTAAMAEDVTLTACTKDGHTVTMKADIEGTLENGRSFKSLAQSVFREIASDRNAADFDKDNTGRVAFIEALIPKMTGIDKIKIGMSIVGAPACTVTPAP